MSFSGSTTSYVFLKMTAAFIFFLNYNATPFLVFTFQENDFAIVRKFIQSYDIAMKLIPSGGVVCLPNCRCPYNIKKNVLHASFNSFLND